MTALAYAPRARSRSIEPSAEPNVIPFIDVLLVLLIIFMVTAPKPTTEIQLELPVRPQLIAVAIPPAIVDITASSAGYRIFLDGEEVELAALPAALLAGGMSVSPALTEDDVFDEAHVSVRAQDQGVAYGHVVEVLDALKFAGFAKVGVFAQMADGA